MISSVVNAEETLYTSTISTCSLRVAHLFQLFGSEMKYLSAGVLMGKQTIDRLSNFRNLRGEIVCVLCIGHYECNAWYVIDLPQRSYGVCDIPEVWRGEAE